MLHEAISSYRSSLVICHESDPAWRRAVLSSRDTLLTLRHMVDEGADEYKIIMLYKRHLSFKVIKARQQCVCVGDNAHPDAIYHGINPYRAIGALMLIRQDLIDTKEFHFLQTTKNAIYTAASN